LQKENNNVQAGKETDPAAGALLLINKPLGWTSFDAVAKIRSSLYKKMGKRLKVGHAGTLDPLATGLLIVCTGKYTKRISEFQDMEKEYEAVLKLGATRPSFDKETEIDATFPYTHVTAGMLHEAAAAFTGEIEQTPPVYSAIKVDGKRAYESARRGKDIKMQSRKVLISTLEINRVELPDVHIRVVCGKGTYIRSLARDFGRALNTGAYLDTLKRTRIGIYNLKDAVNVEDV
jgi:tRNA pseudouridine55 synthase